MLLKGLIVACFFSAIAAAYALFQVVFHPGSLSEILIGVASFGCFGFLLGGIYAFDAESEIKVKANPFARIVIGVFAALAVALLWGWPNEGRALSALLGGGLGYFGMSWAKYVNF